ncbi:hypothetical protein BD310DRAFT_960926 [Dichomitus squalens]|uniref:BZIP domain-containing protein n=1 Tax=Dichomitus squalens TaxID=114155 RepID=A0A4Q9PM67_9APHY|nr:hypothetical protein BD310DRAFT_960926 [Dichomitus squalens]
MSSKRGRKRNDNLPPNRARDVQRAFRARRAAHLEALENRVAELEEENNTLRAALSLPPANRPPLGKGPTGKDKPKASGSKSATPSGLLSSLASGGPMPPLSRTESPLSTGSASGHSMSPDPMSSASGLSAPSQTSPPPLDPAGWSDNIFGDKDSDQSLSSNFSLPSTSSHASHNNPFSQIPRSVPNDIFPSAQGFTSSDEKSFGYLPSEGRRSYNYSHPLMSGHPSAQSTLPPSLSSSAGDTNDLAPFLQRRAITEPDGFRTLLNQMQASQNGLQTPAPRMSQSTLLNVVDAPLSEYDLPGGAERRYPRLH